MKKLLNKLRQSREEDAFITFIQVALENEAIRQRVLAILAQEHQQRTTMLKGWVSDLEQEGAPQPFVTAVKYLEEESRANKALMILSKR